MKRYALVWLVIYLGLFIANWYFVNVRAERIRVCQALERGTPMEEVDRAMAQLSAQKIKRIAGKTSYAFSFTFSGMRVDVDVAGDRMQQYVLTDGSDVIGTGPPWDGVEASWGFAIALSTFQMLPAGIAVWFRYEMHGERGFMRRFYRTWRHLTEVAFVVGLYFSYVITGIL